MALVTLRPWRARVMAGLWCLGGLGPLVVEAAPHISAWGSASMAVTTDGRLLSWGYECCARPQGSEVPVQLATGIDKAHTGYSNLSALGANGDLYIWGNNTVNQLLNPALSR